MWARAVHCAARAHFLNLLGIDIEKAGDLIDHLKNLWPGKAVENIAPAAMSRYQTSLSQNHQVLRDTRLAHAQRGFQVADTGFLPADDHEDLDSCWLADEKK